VLRFREHDLRGGKSRLSSRGVQQSAEVIRMRVGNDHRVDALGGNASIPQSAAEIAGGRRRFWSVPSGIDQYPVVARVEQYWAHLQRNAVDWDPPGLEELRALGRRRVRRQELERLDLVFEHLHGEVKVPIAEHGDLHVAHGEAVESRRGVPRHRRGAARGVGPDPCPESWGEGCAGEKRGVESNELPSI
jgi:hypothetical protein